MADKLKDVSHVMVIDEHTMKTLDKTPSKRIETAEMNTVEPIGNPYQYSS